MYSIFSATFSTKHCEYVKPTKTIILECPQNGNVVEWLYRNNTNGKFLTIFQNSVVNPEFGSVTIRNITGGGFYHLQINNATTADEGIYRCTSRNETTNKPIVTDVVLCLMRTYICSKNKSVNRLLLPYTDFRGCRGRDRMVVGLTTTCAISGCHH